MGLGEVKQEWSVARCFFARVATSLGFLKHQAVDSCSLAAVAKGKDANPNQTQRKQVV